MNHHRVRGALIALALVAAACGGDDSDDAATEPQADEPTTEAAAPDDKADEIGSAEDDEPEPEPEPESEPQLDLPVGPFEACAAPIDFETVQPVEPDASPIFEYLAPGLGERARSEQLGVALAFDYPILGPPSVVLTKGFGMNLLDLGLYLHRPAGFETEGAELVDFDTWLARHRDALGVTGDETTTIAGFPARVITYQVDDLSVLDAIDFVPNFGLGGESTWPGRIIEIDLGVDSPLYVEYAAGGPDDPFATLDGFLASLVIGDVVTAPSVQLAERHWDLGPMWNFFPVEGPCELDTLAFGGASFELVGSQRVVGSGAQMWVVPPEGGEWAGTSAPLIELSRPEFRATEDPALFITVPDPNRPIATIDDAVTGYTEAGWVLEERAEGGELLGLPTRVFDFESAGPESAYPFILGSHEGSSSTTGFWIGPNYAGEMHLVESPLGLIVLLLAGQTGTDDGELLRGQFDRILETLTIGENA